MNKIFLLNENGRIYVYKNGISKDECLNLVLHSPPSILHTDVQKWVNKAKHNSSFSLNYKDRLICIDLNQYE